MTRGLLALTGGDHCGGGASRRAEGGVLCRRPATGCRWPARARDGRLPRAVWIVVLGRLRPGSAGADRWRCHPFSSRCRRSSACRWSSCSPAFRRSWSVAIDIVTSLLGRGRASSRPSAATGAVYVGLGLLLVFVPLAGAVLLTQIGGCSSSHMAQSSWCDCWIAQGGTTWVQVVASGRSHLASFRGREWGGQMRRDPGLGRRSPTANATAGGTHLVV